MLFQVAVESRSFFRIPINHELDIHMMRYWTRCYLHIHGNVGHHGNPGFIVPQDWCKNVFYLKSFTFEENFRWNHFQRIDEWILPVGTIHQIYFQRIGCFAFNHEESIFDCSWVILPIYLHPLFSHSQYVSKVQVYFPNRIIPGCQSSGKPEKKCLFYRWYWDTFLDQPLRLSLKKKKNDSSFPN